MTRAFETLGANPGTPNSVASAGLWCTTCARDARKRQAGLPSRNVAESDIKAGQAGERADMRELEYKITKAADGGPLVELRSPMGNGQEIRPDALRSLASRLEAIAEEADAWSKAKGSGSSRIGKATY